MFSLEKIAPCAPFKLTAPDCRPNAGHVELFQKANLSHAAKQSLGCSRCLVSSRPAVSYCLPPLISIVRDLRASATKAHCMFDFVMLLSGRRFG